MARLAVVPATLELNDGATLTLYAATSSGMYIDVAAISDQKLAVWFQPGTTGGDWTITINGGAGHVGSDIGDLTLTAKSTDYQIWIGDSSRFKDASGYITIDITCTGGAIAGYLAAAKLP